MNSDQITGGLDQAAGQVKSAAGALADDAGIKLKGRLQSAAGKAQSLVGDTRETIETQVAEKPIAAMAAIGAVGLAAGLLIGTARRMVRKDQH